MTSLNLEPKNSKTKSTNSLKIVVLVSGYGSNLQSIIDRINSNELAAEIVAIICNKPQAYSLERARTHALPAYLIQQHQGQSREEYDQRLATVLKRIKENSGYDLIVLAGFMRILSTDFVNEFSGKIINIHPSLLPKYRGLHTHKKALKAGDHEHGCSVHFVTPELDGGPVIAQAKLAVKACDDIESLSARVQLLEHKLYPKVLAWFAGGRIEYRDDSIFMDGTLLQTPYQS